MKRGFIYVLLALVACLLILWVELSRDVPKPLEEPHQDSAKPPPKLVSPSSPSFPKPELPEGFAPLDSEDSLEVLAEALLRRGRPSQDIVVVFSSPQEAAEFAAEAPLNGMSVIDDSEALSSLRLRLSDPLKAIDFLKDLEDDAQLEWNRPVQAPPLPRPEYLDGERAFGDQAAQWMDVPTERSEWGRGVTVAILDSGVDMGHSSLAESKISAIDLVGGTTGPDGVYLGHGTAVASIVAGAGEDLQGLAPSAEVLSIRVLDGEGRGDSFTVARGIVEAVDRGAKVINLSLGSDSSSQVLENAVNYARQKGSVVVAAVGNDGARGVSFPARYEGVVGVTSVDAKGRQSAFANYGEQVDIAAPGIGVHAAWSGDEKVSFSGTSSSTAFVSGALAAEISLNPGMNPDQVVEMLYGYSNEAEKPGKDLLTGHGILNVGRVQNRDTLGIRDAAVVGYYFDPAQLKGGTTPFLVSVQNQGTEWLSGVSLEVDYNGVKRNFLLGSLDPGQVRSEKLFLDADSASDPDGVRIVSNISISGGGDVKPSNDTRASRITLPAP